MPTHNLDGLRGDIQVIGADAVPQELARDDMVQRDSSLLTRRIARHLDDLAKGDGIGKRGEEPYLESVGEGPVNLGQVVGGGHENDIG